MQINSQFEKDEFVPPDLIELVNGVYLLKMPLPFRLDHINIYLLEDDDGWNVVDCGLDNDDTIRVWEYIFANTFREKGLKSVFVTHLHPDHIGVAYWLRKKSGAKIYITSGEWTLANQLLSGTSENSTVLYSHYKRFGLNEIELEKLVKRGPNYSRLVKELPNKVELMQEGDIFNLAGRDWQVVIGRGHSPEHACFWNKAEKLLISGDHILPTITPNISLMALGLKNPLQDYLATLEKFLTLEAELLFPAHGEPIRNVNARIEELIQHHDITLMKLLEFCIEPKTVNDCALYLFGENLPSHQFGFAIGEAAAHLLYLSTINKLRLLNDQVWEFTI